MASVAPSPFQWECWCHSREQCEGFCVSPVLEMFVSVLPTTLCFSTLQRTWRGTRTGTPKSERLRNRTTRSRELIEERICQLLLLHLWSQQTKSFALSFYVIGVHMGLVILVNRRHSLFETRLESKWNWALVEHSPSANEQKLSYLKMIGSLYCTKALFLLKKSQRFLVQFHCWQKYFPYGQVRSVTMCGIVLRVVFISEFGLFRPKSRFRLIKANQISLLALQTLYRSSFAYRLPKVNETAPRLTLTINLFHEISSLKLCKLYERLRTKFRYSSVHELSLSVNSSLLPA